MTEHIDDKIDEIACEDIPVVDGVKKVAVIVQCRLSSTRLPGKALSPIAGMSLLEWTLLAMKKVPADFYYVATDYDSYDELSPVAKRRGWQVFAGPLDNVLERFCLLIKKIGADVVVRATADNPFLFYEAACGLLCEFAQHKDMLDFSGGNCTCCKCDNSNNDIEKKRCDYITYTGLPHGSGVEIFDAHSLLRAAQLTDDAYDKEHVGPVLYNHPENFQSIFVPAPECFCLPEYRTTVDTERDFRRAQQIAELVFRARKNNYDNEILKHEAFTAEEIINALQLPQIARSILFFPSAQKGCGTGHLRRCLKVAAEIGATVFVPDDATLPETNSIVSEAKQNGLLDWQITSAFPNKGDYALIVTDAFMLDEDIAKKLSEVSPICSLDEGGDFHAYSDYLLDIIPSLSSEKRHANHSCQEFMELPKNIGMRKNIPAKVLVCFGGEDPSGLTIPVAEKFASLGFEVTAICGSILPSDNNPKCGGNIMFVDAVTNLREKLFDYDIVATHYGLTAYEARAAGCTVITFATTDLHKKLSEKYGFACLEVEIVTKEKIFSVHEECGRAFEKFNDTKNITNKKTLVEFLEHVSYGRKISCPICSSSAAGEVVARTERRTFRRCNACGIVYMAWTEDTSHRKYSASYFADEYKAQYGKTYIEDFESIKKQCVRRMENISALSGEAGSETANGKKTVLDIGCAYGAFLAAAAEKNWLCFGTDISDDAVEYVRSTLRFPAVTASFPDIDTKDVFGNEAEQFDAVTMWFVIEHFSELSPVLQKVSSLTKKGGIFSFSTPSGEGVSAKYNHQHFFEQSPADHYTIWEPSQAAKVLEKFGFVVEKIVSTGHHAERFPEVKEKGFASNSKEFAEWTDFSVKNNLGDTFEVYCRKVV